MTWDWSNESEFPDRNGQGSARWLWMGVLLCALPAVACIDERPGEDQRADADCGDACDGGTDAGVRCGNGLREPPEVCDGTDLGAVTCSNRGAGFTGGEIRCAADCYSFDTSLCYTCGNGVLEAGELCDGTDLDSQSCVGIDALRPCGRPLCTATCDDVVADACGAPEVVHHFSQRYGEQGHDGFLAAEVDGAGNIYLLGLFGGAVTFGGDTHDPLDASDIVLVKLGPTGQVLWSRVISNTLAILDVTMSFLIGYSPALAVDGNGEITLVGGFVGTANFGGADLVSAGGTDIFIVRLGPNGAHRWSQRVGTANDDMAMAVAVDDAGDAVVTGSMDSWWGTGMCEWWCAHSDFWVTRFDAAGDQRWERRYRGPGSGMAVGLGPGGDAVVAGVLGWSLEIGGTSHYGDVFGNVVLARFDNQGNPRWSVSAVLPTTTTPLSLAVAANGHIIVGGTYLYYPPDFGLGPLPYPQDVNGFLAGFDADGQVQWNHSFGDQDTTTNAITGLALTGSGAIAVTGLFDGPTSFGGTTFTPAGLGDGFLGLFEAGGQLSWVQTFGDADASEMDRGHDIAVAPDGALVVAGAFADQLDLGGGPLTAAGPLDAFVAKIHPQDCP